LAAACVVILTVHVLDRVSGGVPSVDVVRFRERPSISGLAPVSLAVPLLFFLYVPRATAKPPLGSHLTPCGERAYASLAEEVARLEVLHQGDPAEFARQCELAGSQAADVH